MFGADQTSQNAMVNENGLKIQNSKILHSKLDKATETIEWRW